MDIFFEIHNGLAREAPGDDRSTLQAFELINDLPPDPLILDIGCGPGAQTLALASQTKGRLIALDTHAAFLARLQHQAHSRGFKDRIRLVNGSMFDLPFRRNSFDCIWSEGAIYIIGLKKGLQTWKTLLKPGGWLAVTELSWLEPTPPPEALAYWSVEYPGMGTINQNLEIIRSTGYREKGHFILPASCWWDGYYTPLERSLSALEQKYEGNEEAAFGLEATRTEIKMYRKYSKFYGYVFYILQME